MSTLKTSNIQDTSGNNNSTPEEINQGRAKAWVSFNGTGTLSINDSFNVSSVTDTAVGQYTVNYTNAFANTSYAVIHGAIYAAGSGFYHSYYNLTASSVTFLIISSSASYTDSSHVSAAFFGD